MNCPLCHNEELKTILNEEDDGKISSMEISILLNRNTPDNATMFLIIEDIKSCENCGLTLFFKLLNENKNEEPFFKPLKNGETEEENEN